MTCGFFIFSVPCLSKLIMESGLPSRVKRALGDSGAKNSDPSYENSSGPRSGSGLVRKPWKRPVKNPETTWSQIDDYNIPLSSPGVSESQENLNQRLDSSREGSGHVESGDGTERIQVTHTTNVTVSREPGAGSGVSSPITPWVKKG
jgi:hypothetical protein